MTVLSIEGVMRHDLGQAAFSAYVDAAQAEGEPHNRLVAGSFAAARAVISRLIESGDIRPTLMWEAAHGTQGGYNAGCRCEFCTDAHALLRRAQTHWNAAQGHNKVRA